MRHKRIVCAVVAFLMVGANLLGAGRVFAEEIGGGDEGGAAGLAGGEGGGNGGNGTTSGVAGEGAEGAGTEGGEGGDELVGNGATGEGAGEGTEGGSGAEGGAGAEGDGVGDGESAEGEAGEGIESGAGEGTEGGVDGDALGFMGVNNDNSELGGNTRGDGGRLGAVITRQSIAMAGETVKFDTRELTIVHGIACHVPEGAYCNIETGEVTFNQTGLFIGTYEYMGQSGELIVQDTSFMLIFVFDVEVDGSAFHMSPEDEEKIRQFTSAQLKEMMLAQETENQYLVIDNWTDVMESMNGNMTFKVKAEKIEIEEEYWQSDTFEAADLVLAEKKDDETTVLVYLGYLCIYVGDDDTEVGMIYELAEPVTLWTVMPESAMNVPAGFAREFSVIRGHMALDDTKTANRFALAFDGVGYGFSNTKFSSFMFVYKDVPVPVTPNTGAYTREGGSASSSFIITILAGVALTVAYGAVKFAKR